MWYTAGMNKTMRKKLRCRPNPVGPKDTYHILQRLFHHYWREEAKKPVEWARFMNSCDIITRARFRRMTNISTDIGTGMVLKSMFHESIINRYVFYKGGTESVQYLMFHSGRGEYGWIKRQKENYLKKPPGWTPPYQ